MAKTNKTTATTATTASAKGKNKKMNVNSKVETTAILTPTETPNANKAITDIMEIKNTMATAPDGKVSITYDGMTVTEDETISDIKLPKISSIIFNEKATNIKSHCEKLDKYAKMAKISTVYMGKELYAIQQDKSYKELGLTSFEQFYEKLELPKSTTYHYITGFLMVCDCFGTIDEKALEVGEATAYKAKRLGMSNVEFQHIVHEADREGVQITTANLIDKAKDYGIKMDADKVEAERKKESRGIGKGKGKKSVIALPAVAKGELRFMRLNSKTEYIDVVSVPLMGIVPEKRQERANTLAWHVLRKANEGLEEKDSFDSSYATVTMYEHNIFVNVILVSPVGRIWVYTYSEHINTTPTENK